MSPGTKNGPQHPTESYTKTPKPSKTSFIFLPDYLQQQNRPNLPNDNDKRSETRLCASNRLS